MSVAIRHATQADALHVAAHMRLADAEECWAALRQYPRAAVLGCLERSAAAWCAEFDGEPGCLFGYALPDFVSAHAAPWLLTTDLVARNKMAFARNSRKVIDALLERFESLSGLVDSRYTTCIRWMRWAGFFVYGEHLLNGVPFHYYQLRR